MQVLKDAEVIDNNDPNKKGYIQVRILPEFIDVQESKLPWVQPYFNGVGISSEHGLHNVPEIGDRVKIIVKDKYWKDMEYFTGEYIEGKYIYSKWQGIQNNITNNSGFTYPQPAFFKHFPDGTAIYHNSETGESGIVSPNGDYININGDGKITLKSKNDIEVDADGEEVITANGITIEGKAASKITIKNSVEGADLKGILSDIQSVLQNLVTPGVITSPVGPCIYINSGTDLPKMTQVLINLGLLLDS